MLNYRTVLSHKSFPKKWLLGLGIISVAAIANALFSLEHDWHLLSITTMMVGGTLLFTNVRKSFAAANEQPQVIDRSFLFKELEQIQKAIVKIANPIERESLDAQARQISSNLQKNHFRIVIFGTGSAGKTSVLNALMGRKLGKTGAEIGTTTNRQEYAYQGIDFSPVGINPIHSDRHLESKLKRQISLLDTSGTQEMGAMGQQRELESRQIARNADLMVFVTAGDLTNSEYRDLEDLTGLGKRVILVFNKTDLYLPSDREGILKKLKQRTAEFLAETDIVAVSAQPSPIKVRQYSSSSAHANSPANSPAHISAHHEVAKEWWEELPPDVSALKERIESILSNEWEDLLISNTHQQIVSLWQAINGAIAQERRQDATTIINRYQFIAATTVFANPIPAIDLLAGAAINTQMLIDLAKTYDRPLNFKQAQQYAMTIAQQLLQLGCIEIATSAIASCFKVNAVTYAIGGSVQAVTAAYLTHVGGMSFVAYLEQPEIPSDLRKSPISLDNLQQICQRTFQAFQSDRFVMDFVTNISRRVAAN
ncbi:YcjF family protein [Pseudanabaena sp. 'Roaring Creek']|uniref:YcjF family protein n=1 Tax=Pseudanabaena sp. 'Roaring Creek' TaxID=1681830 RepID=UPI0006D8083A|nr:GTP-binding protein [Pseudanabaena sp. 'Roaring Creek']